MSVAPARRVALAVLARVRRDAAFSGAVLSHELGRARLSPADAALATRLAYGSLAAEGVLDEAIGRHARGSLEPLVRDALRLATFELLFSRAPVYAVIDEGVAAVRAARQQAAGLANAVLRKIAAEAADFPWGDPATDIAALARATAHPLWIAEMVLEEAGEERGRDVLAGGLEPAPSYVRIDPFVAPRDVTAREIESIGGEPCPPDLDCYVLEDPGAAYRSGSAGGWFAMDAAAQMAPLVCRPAAGLDVIDVGAGRGNKTVCLQAIATRGDGPCRLVAIDAHAGKARGLEDRIERSGVPSVTVEALDALELPSRFGAEAFDIALVDAPCSGLGTLRRYPEKRWRLDPGTPARMAGLQLALLESAAAVVRPGGRVVYSTCSIAPLENRGVMREFLEGEHGGSFAIEGIAPLLPGEWASFEDADGCFQSWPSSGQPDGHYVAALRRHPA